MGFKDGLKKLRDSKTTRRLQSQPKDSSSPRDKITSIVNLSIDPEKEKNLIYLVKAEESNRTESQAN